MGEEKVEAYHEEQTGDNDDALNRCDEHRADLKTPSRWQVEGLDVSPKNNHDRGIQDEGGRHRGGQGGQLGGATQRPIGHPLEEHPQESGQGQGQAKGEHEMQVHPA